MAINKLSNFSYSLRKLPVIPPSKPVIVPRFGKYCIKAEADIHDENGEKVGSCIGYDDLYGIVKVVTDACELNTRRRRIKCGPTTVTILPHNSNFVCAGVFFCFTKKMNT
jgi:hypothetical protein